MAALLQSVDQYLQQLPEASQLPLQQVRQLVKTLLPDANEVISYQMPAFKQQRVFCYVGVFKKHLGVYPPLSFAHPLSEQLQPYRGPKGNLQFPLQQPLPIALISQLVLALAAQAQAGRV